MSQVPPSRWHAPGREALLETAEGLARVLATPGAPAPGNWTVLKARPMRVVLLGRLEGPDGVEGVLVKVRRPATTFDRARNRWRPPRAPREGALLEDLRRTGVPVPEVLGWSGDPRTGLDVLVLREVEGAEDLGAWERRPHPLAARRATAEAVGDLLRRAHEAGWKGADLHRGNLLLGPTGLTLLDPGTAPLREPLTPAQRARALGAAAHGLGPDLRAGLRALRAYVGGDRVAARAWAPRVLRAARAARREGVRRRTQRSRRNGLHFAGTRTTEGLVTLRHLDRAPERWTAEAARLLAGEPAGARPLKADRRVLAVRLPDLEATVVLKRYAPRWKDRLRPPRALRAFHRAHGLRVRGVAAPEPLWAASSPAKGGVYVAAAAGPPEAQVLDLHAGLRPDADATSPYGRLSRGERAQALHRLGRFLRRLHDAEVTHRDLKAPNLVAWRGPQGFAFALVDLDGARLRDRPVSWRRRARDLARLDASVGSPVSRTDRLRVLRGYLACFARAGMPKAEFARRIARASARKRAPTGAPR